jgi:hypothetical protein
MSKPIVLTPAEYDVLWTHLRLGPQPTVLWTDGRPSAHTPDDVWRSLRAKGLAGSHGVDPALADRLTALARPTWSIDARLHLDGRAKPRVSALAAAAGETAVLAARDAGALTLYPVRPGGLATAMVALLPVCRAGSGVSITLPAAHLDAAAARAGDNAPALQRELAADGLDRDAARKIADVLRDVIRTGQFGVAYTPSFAAVRRAGHVITFYDTNNGRYLFVRRPSNGTEWITVVGADKAKIAGQLDELRRELAD